MVKKEVSQSPISTGTDEREEKDMYMSYCRFEGTRQELRACINEVENHIYEEAEYEVSDNEIREFKQMVKDFYNFMADMELLDENGELDENVLDEISEKMALSFGEDC